MARTPISLEDALKNYDRESDQTLLALAEQERHQVLDQFPLEEWPGLPLSRYALGQGDNQNSYCWWMEFGTPHLGSIKGGSARKHSIFYKKNEKEWWFDRQVFKTEEDAWKGVRAGFCKAFEKAKQGEWETIDEIEELSLGHALRAKTLYCYFPEQLLPIASISHVVHFLKLLGVAEVRTNGNEVVRLNRLLLATLREKKEFVDFSTMELGHLLYSWSQPREQRRIVKIAPGRNAEYWEDCLAGGYICVPWDEMGDLRLFDSKESCRQKFDEQYRAENKSSRKTKFKELWTLRELEQGDLIVANQGNSRILAVGEVVEPGYEWLEERKEHKQGIRVKWDVSQAHDIPSQSSWSLLTVAPVPNTVAAQILSTKQNDEKSDTPTLQVEAIFSEIAAALAQKGQAILYGPPGTGKTFTARRFAVWWLLNEMGGDSSNVLNDAKAFEQAEKKLSSAQVVPRVWWVVANPSQWSWEQLFKNKRGQEFRYGRLSRNYPLVRKGDLVVGYQSTPDKKIVALARISREMFTNDQGETKIELVPVSPIALGLTFEELQNDEVLSKSEPMQFNNQGTLFKLTEDEFSRLAALLSEREPELQKHLESEDAVGPLTMLTFHASYSYEDFIEGYRPADSNNGMLSLKMDDGIFKRICRAAEANPKKKYLVWIDEINRANVAKVLGELITLLEKDKRGLRISLPQSKESFTIPQNVYLLGTMNTADRSIKLLDAALRRRFSFIELMPDSTRLAGAKVGTLELSQFLDELNRRIVEREGREKQIGHSFLMDGAQPVTDPVEFARLFRQEILPLLQEYCYDDDQQLANYIGDELTSEDGESLISDSCNDPEQLIAALERAFQFESSR